MTLNEHNWTAKSALQKEANPSLKKNNTYQIFQKSSSDSREKERKRDLPTDLRFHFSVTIVTSMEVINSRDHGKAW